VKVKVPPPSAGVLWSVTISPLPSGAISALSNPGAAALILVRTSPRVVSASTCEPPERSGSVDRARGHPVARLYRISATARLIRTRCRRSAYPDACRCTAAGCPGRRHGLGRGQIDVVQTERSGGGAVADFLHLEVRWPIGPVFVDQTDFLSPWTSAVTLIPEARVGWRPERRRRSGRSRDRSPRWRRCDRNANLAAGEPRAVSERTQLGASLDIVTEAKGDRAAAESLRVALQARAEKLLALNGAQRGVLIGPSGGSPVTVADRVALTLLAALRWL